VDRKTIVMVFLAGFLLPVQAQENTSTAPASAPAVTTAPAAASVSAPAPPSAPAPASVPAPADPQAPAADPTLDTAAQYLIGPGDQLQIFVWNHPELSPTVPVRPDGRISTPLVENMVAVRKTPPQLARDIEAVLKEYIRAPKVNVIVTMAQSTFSQIKVVGQVAHPQAVPYHEGMTVLDVILQVGGLAPYAAGNRARLVRTENGKTVEIRVRLVDLTQKGDVKQNVAVKPGDLLVVPQAFF
jgi:polysaccharide export outer membrane protein